MKIGEIRPITLIRFFREATKERQHTHKRISNARSVLNGIMSYAIEEEIISHNPVSDVNFKQFTYKPVEVQSDNVFSREDTHKLLHYLAVSQNLIPLQYNYPFICLSVSGKQRQSAGKILTMKTEWSICTDRLPVNGH